MHGKHGNRPNSISSNAKGKIRAHIKFFPCRQSHYSRASNIKRKYLDGGLSISRMNLLFLPTHGVVKESSTWTLHFVLDSASN